MAGSTMQVNIVAADHPVWHGTAKSVTIPASEGGMGILPDQGFDNIPSMFHDVYAETPWHLAEQCEQSLDEAREYLGREPK